VGFPISVSTSVSARGFKWLTTGLGWVRLIPIRLCLLPEEYSRTSMFAYSTVHYLAVICALDRALCLAAFDARGTSYGSRKSTWPEVWEFIAPDGKIRGTTREPQATSGAERSVPIKAVRPSRAALELPIERRVAYDRGCGTG